MPEPRIFHRKEISESGTKYCRARLTNRQGVVTVQSDYGGSIGLTVYDITSSTPQTAVFQTNRTVAGTIFNALQDWGENVDSVGFNFEDEVTSNELGDSLNGAHTLRFCYRLNHTVEGVRTVIFEGRVLPHLGA